MIYHIYGEVDENSTLYRNCEEEPIYRSPLTKG